MNWPHIKLFSFLSTQYSFNKNAVSTVLTIYCTDILSVNDMRKTLCSFGYLSKKDKQTHVRFLNFKRNIPNKLIVLGDVNLLFKDIFIYSIQ